ncbi:helix-turn-helix transcriptional regulator [Priestia aryabhattai]|uniref:helix-turn-helix transcriptional regulator n=1 Tax=Priestia aryabhattai TaxID=412384 RepID=UPI002E1B84CE|nr:helix-turn-helix transcriptional regulator [Priestia aryabhattai]MED4261504.1 helix-turn-helix transcriptional regulator [Priestia aryabhattai]
MPVSKIKIARIEKDLTQKDLANKVNVTRQTIGLIEAGKYNPSLKLCLDIAKVLNKTLDELFWEETNNEI